MLNHKSRYHAKFIKQEYLNNKFLHRRLHFVGLRDDKGNLLRDNFCIEETDDLKLIGCLNYGDIIGFDADLKLENIKFRYPHGKLEEE